jgi:hypothetical protein
MGIWENRRIQMRPKRSNVDKKVENDNFEIIGHGENSVTYQLFNELDKHKLSLLLNNNTNWINKIKIKKEDIEEVHLFPSFGKRYGYGEPDVLILASKIVIYVEVELCDLERKKLPDPFVKQMEKFKNLANDISKSDRKKLRLINKFEGECGYKFLGQKKLRSLYSKIKDDDRVPCLLVISNSSSREVKAVDLERKMKSKGLDLNGLNLGWGSFRKIRNMKQLSSTAKTIKYNLDK